MGLEGRSCRTWFSWNLCWARLRCSCDPAQKGHSHETRGQGQGGRSGREEPCLVHMLLLLPQLLLLLLHPLEPGLLLGLHLPGLTQRPLPLLELL